MNVAYPFPLQIYGDDGLTYILDQFADSDGVFRFHVLQRNGPYSYSPVYAGPAFILKNDAGEQVGDSSNWMVSHFIGSQNTTDVLPGNPASNSLSKTDASKMKYNEMPTFNWGSLLQSLPSVIGHVIQVGTTIAKFLSPSPNAESDQVTMATNTLKT